MTGLLADNNVGLNVADVVWDANGYVFYCPCHGRFGNQADQFLGSFAFSKQLNRTLVLPPWRTYAGEQKMAPFDDFFQVDPLRAYHRVILAKDFVDKLATSNWPLAQRSAFCYMQDDNEKPCTTSHKFFQEFWRFVGIPAFTKSENIKGLRFDVSGVEAWRERFPASKFPVIALRGPPAPFPVPQMQWPIQQYLQWSPKIYTPAKSHIESLFRNEPYLGIHLRNGEDWTKACALLDEDGRHGLTNLMASSQCIGEHPAQPVTKEQCFPSKAHVINTVEETVKEYGLKNVYIATDSDSYISEFRGRMPAVNFVHLNPTVPQIDLCILGESDIFIGNCVSSFSSFVRRQREVNGKATLYFGMPIATDDAHNEL
ncbi:GDP-fucose protein O-fucosyltransferase 1 [Hypsibius exemplaris]|uniref:GDP-fucose protein O-fucosyltransferase 1 n=1 Tax=Hypsibius exemplaris TaxID=2072580 RepID=A0A1W0XB22_HYPEX|nr:GDP-fucose protein O-fucosyltransferase 1 [Hypsibius exemplaris]